MVEEFNPDNNIPEVLDQLENDVVDILESHKVSIIINEVGWRGNNV